MGVPVVVRSGSGHGAELVVPRGAVRELLERALANPLLGPAQLQVTDTRARLPAVTPPRETHTAR